MTGTHYTLDRDKPENQNPMDLVKEKACGRCGTVKPNDFKHYGKKLWKTRHDLTTTDICIGCQKAKVSASMKARWAERKGEVSGFIDEAVRMAQTLAVERPVTMREPDPEAEVVKPLDQHEDSEIRPMTLEESVDSSEGERILINRESDTSAAVGGPRVETESERLMREFLSGG